ncbi:MAG: hypothetical protein WC191_08705 [Proteiniphilum sp.]|jgi:hypothetical protein|nr:hypothetical protein [Proteiniphilum sp.]MDD3555347.1 hypothetical protein [Proteiniphilum sp.]MDD5346674.1 hypothetical protein [Proteiniphilum sp.]MDD5620336.1 hypothetical protein [Proteiniphilum sp.]
MRNNDRLFVNVSRCPQLVFGNLSGEGFVKREGRAATSSLLETETTTGQRINADERNIHENQRSQLDIIWMAIEC